MATPLLRAFWWITDDEPMVVRFEMSCVVPDDPGSIVQHAHPITDDDRQRIREQQIGRLRRDDAAIMAREGRRPPASAPHAVQGSA